MKQAISPEPNLAVEVYYGSTGDGGLAVRNNWGSSLKRLRIIAALLVAGGILTLAGVVLAQQAGWIAPLVEEYSLIWKEAYDETAKYDLPPAGREYVADRVLDAHIATSATPSSGGAPPAAPAPRNRPVYTDHHLKSDSLRPVV